MSEIATFNNIEYSNIASFNHAEISTIAAINNVPLPIIITDYFGYLMGGYVAALRSNKIHKATFSTGAWSTLATDVLDVSTYLHGGCGDTIKGYVGGGYSTAAMNIVEKMTYSTETVATIAGTLSVTRYYPVGLCDRTTYGYMVVGYAGGASQAADRITLSTDAVASTTNFVAPGRYNLEYSGLNGPLYGYLGGGAGPIDTVSTLQWSTGITANNASGLSAARSNVIALSDQTTYGYFCGGNTGAYVATTDRVTFSTNVVGAATGSNLSVARLYTAGVMCSTYGYASGGYTPSVAVTTTDKMTFSTATFAADTAHPLDATHYYGPALNTNGF